MAKLLPTREEIIEHNKERVRMAIIRAWEDEEIIDEIELARRLHLDKDLMEDVLLSLEGDKSIRRVVELDVL